MTDKGKKIHNGKEEKDSDAHLWEIAIKDVDPLKGYIADPAQFLPPAGRKIAREYSPPSPHYEQPIGIDKNHAGSREVDYQTSRKLKRGQIPIEAQIDLHGMSKNKAYDALNIFVPQAYNNGKRCILIITGKGARKAGSASLLDRGEGILRQIAPVWLNSPPLDQYVLKAQTARPQHGGEGALYVLLRRDRQKTKY